jgi:hypothetical protein
MTNAGAGLAPPLSANEDRKASLQRLLTPEQEKILRRERTAARRPARAAGAPRRAPEEDVALLHQAQEQLDELFLLVIVGEFNAGKTAFLNAMLGDRLLAEGVLPTTSTIPGAASRRRIPPGTDRPGDSDGLSAGGVAPGDQPGGHARHQRRHPTPPGDHRTLSCRAATWCSLSPAPTAPSARANAPSLSASASGARRSSS